MFVSGKDGSVLSYSGDRSEDDLISFVKRRGAPAPEEEEGKQEQEDEDYYAEGGLGAL